jgi:asparagine synthase (glutamine-hydrolysing)
MCGINGFVVPPHREGFSDALSRMNNASAHRGPDGEGVFFHDSGVHRVGLGHRRLSIIDLTASGNQPMHSYDNRYTLVYNGEIYNFKELKNELSRVSSGSNHISYPFSTQSDSEVILAGYQRWGEDLPRFLDGMFAFAIYDKLKDELFISRDRFGKKPLYYYMDAGSLIFSSEIRSLLESGWVPRKLNRSALGEYFRYQTVHAPQTLVRDVFCLMPGHSMHFNSAGLLIKPYYTLNREIKNANSESPDLVRKNIKALLYASVEKRLVSDVPVGAFLSGGIDSSIVSAIMAEVSSSPVHTFSVVFDEAEFSEDDYSTLISEKYKTHHHRINLSGRQLLESVPHALGAYDHPGGDGINTWVVSKAVREEGYKVALSGLGSDEIFGGYHYFRQAGEIMARRWLFSLPVPLRKAMAGFYRSIKMDKTALKKAEILCSPSGELRDIYKIFRSSFSPETLELLLEIPKPERDYLSELLAPVPGEKETGIYGFVSRAEICTYLNNVLLRDTDVMSMSHGLEVRAPFLDYRLVEYVISLPDTLKKGSFPKSLLVDSLPGVLPPEIYSRKKMGFTLPWEQWMKTELKDVFYNNLYNLSARDFIGKITPLNLWEDFLKGNPAVTWSSLFHLMVLEDWLVRNQIDE